MTSKPKLAASSLLQNTTTIRPGLLVSIKSTLHGGISYQKRDIEANHKTSVGSARAKWETTRVITYPEEYERATQERSAIRACVTAVCAPTAFGALCPEDRAEDLAEAIKAAYQRRDAFNRSSKTTKIGFYVLTGRIAPDDVEAVRAINSEVRDLIADMQEGLKNLDVKVVRDAANKARGLGAMLTPDAQARIQIAIDAARNCARRIVKAGETAAAEVDKATLRKLTESRTAFLDMSEEQQVATPKSEARAIDLDMTDSVPTPPVVRSMRRVEI